MNPVINSENKVSLKHVLYHKLCSINDLCGNNLVSEMWYRDQPKTFYKYMNMRSNKTNVKVGNVIHMFFYHLVIENTLCGGTHVCLLGAKCNSMYQLNVCFIKFTPLNNNNIKFSFYIAKLLIS